MVKSVPSGAAVKSEPTVTRARCAAPAVRTREYFRREGVWFRVPTLMMLLGGCLAGDENVPRAAGDAETGVLDVPVLSEAFETPRDTVDNIDSPAVWHRSDGSHWLLATAKETDVVVVADAASGAVLRRFGGEGAGAGQLDRPNGIAVVDDLLFVVERDNRRVQLFRLPDLAPLGVYGAGDLRRPYGIAVVPVGGGIYRTFITDNYELREDVPPPDSLLGQRVREYRVAVEGGALSAELVGTFGETAGAGVLRVVESIAADPENDRLLIAEEQEGASTVKVYTLGGRFTGEVLDQRYFPHQAEGIVLYSCPDGGGHWIATDQSELINTFHVFDRGTLEHQGSFHGRTVRNTDGIALSQVAFGDFTAGAFYAVHDDGGVAAFQWSDIADALSLRADCVLGQ
jgi:3-phytase